MLVTCLYDTVNLRDSESNIFRKSNKVGFSIYDRVFLERQKQAQKFYQVSKKHFRKSEEQYLFILKEKDFKTVIPFVLLNVMIAL